MILQVSKRKSGRYLGLVVLLSITGPPLVTASPVPGDYIIASRTYGTIYAVDPSTGLIRERVSGPDLINPTNPIRGSGLSLANSFDTDIQVLADGHILARFELNDPTLTSAIVSIDPFTGDRTLLAENGPSIFEGAGHMLRPNGRQVIGTDDKFAFGQEGEVTSYDVDLGTANLISGPTRGTGPIMLKPRSIAQGDDGTLYVGEFQAGGLTASGIYSISPTTGDRTFLSRVSVNPLSRETVDANGIRTPITLGDDEGGMGPVTNVRSWDLAFIDGRLFSGFIMNAGSVPEDGEGGIFEIDLVTGDRTLLVGRAFVDDGTATNTIEAIPSNQIDVLLAGPNSMIDDGNGNLLFTNRFEPESIFRFDPNSRELFEIADIAAQVDPVFQNTLGLTGLAVYVPEPSTAVLLMVGSLVALLRVRRARIDRRSETSVRSGPPARGVRS